MHKIHLNFLMTVVLIFSTLILLFAYTNYSSGLDFLTGGAITLEIPSKIKDVKNSNTLTYDNLYFLIEENSNQNIYFNLYKKINNYSIKIKEIK